MKREFFILSLLLIQSLVSFAGVNASELRDPETVPEEQRPLGFEGVRRAAVRFNMDCSGIYISNHGHILTALHCLSIAPSIILPSLNVSLVTSKLSDNTPVFGSEDLPFDVREFDGPGKKMRLVGGLQLTGKVLVMGKGYYPGLNHFAAAEKDPETYSDIMKGGYGPPEDFAIVKIDADNTPCVSIAKENAQIGDEVWTIGYPMRLDSINGRSKWTGSAPGAFSSGYITRGFDDIPRIQEILKSSLNSHDAQLISLVRSAVNRDGTFFSSLDGLSGSSGSAIINKEGKVVGVFNATEEFGKPLEQEYMPGVSTGATIQRVVTAAKEQLNASTFKEVFSCNSR